MNISFVAFFLSLGGLGAENQTFLSSKQSILKDYHTKEILFVYAINNHTSFQSSWQEIKPNKIEYLRFILKFRSFDGLSI